MAAKKVTKKRKDISKSDIEGFRGGLSIDLDRKMDSGKTLKEELSQHIAKTLRLEKKNHDELCNNLVHWHEDYKGYRGPKSWPWERCANVAIPIIRSNTDAIFVRIIDALFNKVKLWIIKAIDEDLIGFDRQLEEQLNYFQKYILKLKKKIYSPLLECVKFGTGFLNVVNEEKHKTIYRYADPEELRDDSIKKYKLKGTRSKAVKSIETTYSGPNVYPVPRADMIVSSDATNIEDAYLVGFKKDYRKPQLDLKVRQKLYYKDAVDKISQSDKTDESKEARARTQGKEIEKTDYEKPYEIWVLHLDYDVDEDGEEDSIVVTFHLNTEGILRAIFNPLFKGFKPFIPLIFYPTEYSLDGEGVCGILENLQVQIDTIVNQRLDRMTQINAPMLFVRVGSGLEDFKISPGKVQPVNDELEGALKEVAFHDVYYSTFNEEDRLVNYANRAVGITPDVLGISTAERPVAKETLTHLQEANKKFKSGIDNLRDCMAELAWMLLDFFIQYQPKYTYKTREGEEVTEQTVKFPVEILRESLRIELATASEMLNQEVRREINLTVYTILKEYMTSLAGMGQLLVSKEVPSDFKKILIESNRISVKVLNRILEDFEIRDADDLVLDLEKVIDSEKVVQQSVDLLPAKPPQPGEQGAQQPGQAPPQGMQAQRLT